MRADDFLRGKPSTELGQVQPSYTPGVKLGDLSGALPPYAIEAIREALPDMPPTKLAIVDSEIEAQDIQQVAAHLPHQAGGGAKGQDRRRDHRFAGGSGQQQDRAQQEHQNRDERQGPQRHEPGSPDRRQRDQGPTVGRQRHPDEAGGNDQRGPPGDWRGKVDQGRFLVASALK